jgi:prepilin-type N-terminal cleavage/methylation domain-containing protein
MLKEKTNVNTKKDSKGFTLLELSMVILISGILLVPLLRLYTTYIIHKKIADTKENISEVASAMAVFNVDNYPCPSDRSLPFGDPNHGMDVCTVPGFTLAGVPDCNTTGAEQGICKTPGARDTLDDADTIAGNGNEFVLIGGIPTTWTDTSSEVKTIPGVNGTNILDGWDNKLTYAVSYTSVSSGDGFTRYKNGVIAVQDEFGNATAGTNRDAHFIVISHGPDGLGSFNENGFRRNCTIANADGESCDGDSTFIQGLAQYQGTRRYDDLSYVETDQSAGLWKGLTDSATNPSNHMQTIPMGSVGVGLNPGVLPGIGAPGGIAVTLDVNGTVKAETVRTQQICLPDGSNCINAETLFDARTTAGATRNDCPSGEVVISLGNGRVACGKVNVTNMGVNIRCPAGRWVEQVLTNGRIICTGGVECPGGAGCV